MEKVNKVLFAVIIIALLLLLIELKVEAASDPYISEDYYSYIEEVSEEYCICPEMVCAIIWKESSWNTESDNGSCKGLMQINEKWHKDRMDRLGVKDLMDPEDNILVGIDYLSELFEKYEDPYLVLMMYNMTHYSAMKNYNSGNYSNYAIEVAEISASFEKEKEPEEVQFHPGPITNYFMHIIAQRKWKING